MKKLYFTLLLCFSLISMAQAQFQLGVNAGVPVGDVSDFYVLSAGVDAYYMFGDPDAFLNLGATAGFINYFGDETEALGQTIEFDDVQYLPVALAARLAIASTIIVGPDIGYGVSLTDGVDGGFYYRLVAGIDIANRVQINAFYHSIIVDSGTEGADASSISNVGIGLLLEFASNDN